MNKSYKNNLLFVCLNEKFGETISKSFASELSLHFGNCKELIEYDLFNSGEIIKQFGQEYYLKKEKKVIETICNYENMLIFTNFDIFFHNILTFKKYCLIIYLNIPKKLLSSKDVVNKLAYEGRKADLIKDANLVVNIQSLNEKEAIKQIYKILGGLSEY